MLNTTLANRPGRSAYVVTGPTSGIGRLAALELAKHGTVILVGRDRQKLDKVQKTIERRGQHAVSVVCDLSEVASARRAAREILALHLPIAGLLNNAGMMALRTANRTAQGWDLTFATNYLGPFALTETMLPHLSDGTNVAFVASGVEDPERKPAKAAGFRGGRFISIEASAQGQWEPDGSAKLGFDSYATSKQCVLAAAMALARENPRLRINAIEPGFTPNTGLGRDANALLRFLANYLLPVFARHIKYWSTPKRAARLEATILTATSGRGGTYFDEAGEPMLGSTLAQNPKFQARVVAETRAFLSAVPDPSTRGAP
jgi:NAD(P)-dependent dehydrogenase (short-subunit alcohol dehydrogenase family)